MPEPSDAIAYAKIFPPLGVARVGNSIEPNGYFIAPEWPGTRLSADPAFRYKDSAGNVKRQAVRFRVYGFGNDGSATELTSADCEIEWTVSLANHKASWFEFSGAANALLHFKDPNHEPDGEQFVLRNAAIGKPRGGKKEWDREQRHQLLDIEGGKQKICGSNLGHSPSEIGKWAFKGRFMERNEVYLGELRTDDKGRLLVLSGV